MEGTITPESFAPNLTTLRQKLDHDTQLLSSLDKKSENFRRLQARIDKNTGELLDQEEALEHRRRMAAAEQARQAMPRPTTEVETYAGGGFVLTVAGLLVGYFGWGTWWLALAIMLLFFGVGALVEAAKAAAKGI